MPKLAFTEYNYGGGEDASGLVAQADVLGLFGRFGVFAACNWGINAKHPAQIAAFRAFLDFDGKGTKFGDTMIQVKGENPAENAVFAALDSRTAGRLTLVLVNKKSTPQEFKVGLGSTRYRLAKAFAANHLKPMSPSAITSDVRGSTYLATVPAYGVVSVDLR